MRSKLLWITMGIGTLLAGMYAIQHYDSTVEFIQPDVIEREVEVERVVSEIDKRVQEAQERARADIEAAAQEAYDAMYTLEMDKVEADVLLQVEQEIKERRKEKEEDIGAY